MTDQRTMNSIIHAAFRRDLGRFDGALGSFPAGWRVMRSLLPERSRSDGAVVGISACPASPGVVRAAPLVKRWAAFPG